MDSRDLPIGRRVAWWRARRNMTQQMLADRLGKSKSWVDKVERGVRQLDKISVVRDIARVLRIDTSLLVDGRAPQDGAAGDTDRIDRVRAALARYDLGLSSPVDAPGTSVDELDRRITHAWLTYQHAHYAPLLRMLPDLIADAQRVGASHEPDRTGAPSALVQVYRITSSVLVKLGQPDLAWLAADRAMATAAGERLGSALAAICLGEALRALDQPRLAVAATVTAAHRIAPTVPRQGPPDELSVCGTLLLQAALAAATSGDRRSAEELIGQAAEVADQVGEGHDQHWTGFGPIAVELARMLVAVELGEGVEAVHRHEKAMRYETWRRLPAEHRAAHLVDAARAYLQVGDLGGAGRVLVEADRVAPTEIRSRPLARTLIVDLVHGGPVPAGVAQLATAVGVA